MTLVERLREEIIATAYAERRIVDGHLCERLIRERHAAADEIERLREYPQTVADALARECVKALEAGDEVRAKRMADAQKCVADVYPSVTL